MRSRNESFASTSRLASPSLPITSPSSLSTSPSSSACSSRCNSPSSASSDGSLTTELKSFADKTHHSVATQCGEEEVNPNRKAKDRSFLSRRLCADVQRLQDAGSWNTAGLLIGFYFILNLALTFYNKTLLNSFPYPYLVTAIHAGSGVIGCFCVRLFQAPAIKDEDAQQQARFPVLGKRTQFDDVESRAGLQSYEQQRHGQHVTKRLLQHGVLLAYSALYAANIAVSNASLSLVSVPFHQIIRSTCPLFTAALGLMLLARRPARNTLFPLVPVVAGAALSCFGEVSFTSTGFLLTLLGTALAALKTVTTNLLQGGGQDKTSKSDKIPAADEEKSLLRSCSSDTSSDAPRDVSIRTALCYSPIELLALMSPLACVQCLAVSIWTGELRAAAKHIVMTQGADGTVLQHPLVNVRLLFILIGNGAMAFALNYVSFKTNRAAGPLAMTVVGNLKQVCTIVLAVWLYGVSLGSINMLGIVVALCGTAWYGHTAVQAKKAKR